MKNKRYKPLVLPTPTDNDTQWSGTVVVINGTYEQSLPPTGHGPYTNHTLSVSSLLSTTLLLLLPLLLIKYFRKV